MKRSLVIFFKILILLVAATIIVGMIRFPQLEGRAVNLDLVSIYKDPFIIYSYIASIPFFIILYQVFKLLGFFDNNNFFSQQSVKAVRIIKYCSLAIIGFIILGILCLRLFIKGDDPAGPTALSIIATLIFICIFALSTFFEKRLQKSVNHKKST